MRWLIASFIYLSLSCMGIEAQEPEIVRDVGSEVTLLVPAAPGGGYDRTAQAIKRAMLSEGLVQHVNLEYSPGAGGLIGLAQFIETDLDHPNTLLIAGRTTLGATRHNRSRVSLTDAEPIARLVSPTIALIVPTDSRLGSFGDLAEIIDQDVSLITWYGGSSGSFDEIVVRAVAGTFSKQGNQVAFNAVPGGGDKIIEQLELGDLTVAASSFEEVADAYAAGRVRILAISAPQPNDTNVAPTLEQLGVTLPAIDWRGAFAHPESSEDERAFLEELVKKLVQSRAWTSEINNNFWEDVYLPGADFRASVDADWALIQAQSELTESTGTQSAVAGTILDRRQRNMRFAMYAIIGLVTAILGFLLVYRRQRQSWAETFDEFTEESRLMQEKLDKSHGDMGAHINGEFDKWNLTEAENEIGWMLLKGLSFKEIAIARGRSERTVRQQAQSIYAKSKLQSRSDLAAHFLEDFVFGAAETQ